MFRSCRLSSLAIRKLHHAGDIIATKMRIWLPKAINRYLTDPTDTEPYKIQKLILWWVY